MGSPPTLVSPVHVPAGIKLEDGHATKITFSLDTTIELWEQSVTPPGVEGGDEVDTTTMHNTVWRTKAPRQLKELTESTFTAMYDPEIYDAILSIINIRQTISILFPDASTLTFYGFMKNFIPGDLVEGTMPEATVTIVATNADPIDRSEQAPVLAATDGT